MKPDRVLGVLLAAGFAGSVLAQSPPENPGSDTASPPTQQSTPANPPTAPQSTMERSSDAAASRQEDDSAADSAAASRTEQSPGATRSAATAAAADNDARLVSNLEDAEIYSVADPSKEIGEIEDVLIDRSGQVTHVLISYGGTLGMGEKTSAVPWNVLQSSMLGDRFVLDQSRLENAPTVHKDELTTATGWRDRLDRYWSMNSTPMRRAEGAESEGARPQQ